MRRIFLSACRLLGFAIKMRTGGGSGYRVVSKSPAGMENTLLECKRIEEAYDALLLVAVDYPMAYIALAEDAG